jgi:hypothetical protein
MNSRKDTYLSYMCKRNSIFWCHSSVINDWVQRWLFPDIKQAQLCSDIQNHILNPRIPPELIQGGFSMILACSSFKLTALKSFSSLTSPLSSICYWQLRELHIVCKHMYIATFVTLKNGKFSSKIFASCIIILDAWMPDNQEFIVLVLTQSMLALLIVTSVECFQLFSSKSPHCNQFRNHVTTKNMTIKVF